MVAKRVTKCSNFENCIVISIIVNVMKGSNKNVFLMGASTKKFKGFVICRKWTDFAVS